MKTCNKYSKWLTLYVLGELTEKEKTEYEEHLKSCPICSADVEEERTFTAKLKRTPKIDVSSELLEECRSELRYRLRAEKRKQQLNWWSVITKNMIRLTTPKFATEFSKSDKTSILLFLLTF